MLETCPYNWVYVFHIFWQFAHHLEATFDWPWNAHNTKKLGVQSKQYLPKACVSIFKDLSSKFDASTLLKFIKHCKNQYNSNPAFQKTHLIIEHDNTKHIGRRTWISRNISCMCIFIEWYNCSMYSLWTFQHLIVA